MVEFVIITLCGVICLFIGWDLWKKGQLEMVHIYQFTHISEKK